jgi:uncharacterized protein involved in exopolysaccharide biosynthesis
MREIVTIVFARKQIILGISLLFTTCAVLIAFFWPPTYAVETTILVKGGKLDKSPEALEDAQLRMFELTRKDLMSEMAMIVSPEVIRRTIVHLSQDGRMFPEAGKSEKILKNTILQIRRSLSTEILPDSNIIKVTLTGREPERLLTFMQELDQQYTQQRLSVFHPEITLDFFSTQVNKYDQDLKRQEKKLIDLSRQYQSAEPDKEIDNNLLLQKSLEERLEALQGKRIEKNSHIEAVRHALEKHTPQFFSFLPVLSINQLSEKLQTLMVEKSEILRVYKERNRNVRAIQKQINEIYATLKTEVENYLYHQLQEERAIIQQAETLRARLQAIKSRNLDLRTCLLATQSINRKIDLLNHNHQTFAKRFEEARMKANSNASDMFSISLLGEPYFSGQPLFPQKKKVIGIGIIAGMVLGCGLGFLREYLDHTFKRPEDIVRFAELPVLFSLEKWKI